MNRGFWVFMLAMDLLIPLTMAVFGTLFLTRPPRRKRFGFGYQSTMSLKNEETWSFAHWYCGRLWRRMGLLLLPVSAIPLLFVLGQDVERVGTVGGVVCVVQLIPLFVSVPLTEIALRKSFDANGIRR